MENRYLQWICNSVHADERMAETLGILHDIPFRVKVRRDQNRADDAVNLRYRFGRMYGYPDPQTACMLDLKPASVLEVLAALSLRAGESVYGYPHVEDGAVMIFDEIIRNLRLDKIRADRAVRCIVDNMLNRRYGPDGEGGPFYIPGCSMDMRREELWTQMQAYAVCLGKTFSD